MILPPIHYPHEEPPEQPSKPLFEELVCSHGKRWVFVLYEGGYVAIHKETSRDTWEHCVYSGFRENGVIAWTGNKPEPWQARRMAELIAEGNKGT